MDTRTKFGCELEISEYDPRLLNAFRVATGNRMTEADLTAISNHKHTLYCISSGVGIDQARDMMRVGLALLDAGGTAVKIESSGVAHSGAAWRGLIQAGGLVDFYAAYVVLVGGRDVFYSCGMHNLGLPDASAPRSVGVENAARILNTFNRYQIFEHPTLDDGHTFSSAKDEPRFRIAKASCQAYPAGDPFYNPFGVWKLLPI